MIESEGRDLAALPKWGDPCEQWSQNRPNTLTNAFGVVDEQGQTIKGLHVEFEVFVSPRLGQVTFVFSLMRFELGRIERAYQLHINGRERMRADGHNRSHEHYGEARFDADKSWKDASFSEAVGRFCKNANLTLTEQLPHYQDFALK